MFALMALAVVMPRESQTVPTCMPPPDLQMLVDTKRGQIGQAAWPMPQKQSFAGACKSVSKSADDLPDVISLLDPSDVANWKSVPNRQCLRKSLQVHCLT